MYSKGEDGAQLHQLNPGRKGGCRNDGTGTNLKVHGVDFTEYYENYWDRGAYGHGMAFGCMRVAESVIDDG